MAREDEAIIDLVVECFHTISARVAWPDEALKSRFEARLGDLKALVASVPDTPAETPAAAPEQPAAVEPGNAAEAY